MHLDYRQHRIDNRLPTLVRGILWIIAGICIINCFLSGFADAQPIAGNVPQSATTQTTNSDSTVAAFSDSLEVLQKRFDNFLSQNLTDSLNALQNRMVRFLDPNLHSKTVVEVSTTILIAVSIFLVGAGLFGGLASWSSRNHLNTMIADFRRSLDEEKLRLENFKKQVEDQKTKYEETVTKVRNEIRALPDEVCRQMLGATRQIGETFARDRSLMKRLEVLEARTSFSLSNDEQKIQGLQIVGAMGLEDDLRFLREIEDDNEQSGNVRLTARDAMDMVRRRAERRQ